MQSRRRFLTTTRLACVTSLVRAPHVLAAEGTLETTTVRLVNDTSICIAPEYMAEELLRAEGFTDIRYISRPRESNRWTRSYGASSISRISFLFRVSI